MTCLSIEPKIVQVELSLLWIFQARLSYVVESQPELERAEEGRRTEADAEWSGRESDRVYPLLI